MRQESREMNLQSLDLLTMELNVDPWRARDGEWKSKMAKVGAPQGSSPSIYMHMVRMTKMPPQLYID